MEAVFENVCKVFGFQGLNKFQIEAITHILEKGIDIFVNLPTGYGKSVIHRSCSLTRSLTTLINYKSVYMKSMKDQVGKVTRLNSCSISSILLNEITPER